MLSVLLGVGLLAPIAASSLAPTEAVVRAVDDETPAKRRSREDQRPAGRQLEMGPAATGLAMLALIAAVVVRRRQTIVR